jgi:DNA repair protein RadC
MKTYKTNCPELKVQLSKQEIKKVKVTNSKVSAEFFRSIWEGIDCYESFFCIYLNRANNTIGWYKLSQGGISSVLVDVRLIAKQGIECLASSVILCHNHPSGNMTPSKADDQITEKVKNGLALLDIQVLDHIILSGETDEFYSYADSSKL